MIMRTISCLFALVACLSILGCEPIYGGGEESHTTTQTVSGGEAECRDCRSVELQGCYDGDTCRFSTFDSRVRFGRIDTPELDGDCRRQARAARQALLERLRQASSLCVTKTGMGRYDRPIVEVCADGDNVNNWLMDEGYAVDYGKSTCEREEESDGDPEGESDEPSPNDDDPCSAPDVDCSDLDSCEEARRYLEPCDGDPHRLDADGNGVPCESMCDG